MSKSWAKIIDENTKLCEVGLGTDKYYYKSLGMKIYDVEQDINGCWYIKGYAPQRVYVEYKEKRIAELKELLKQYDYIGTKIATGCATIEEYKEEIELCESYRNEIRKLQSNEYQGEENA